MRGGCSESGLRKRTHGLLLLLLLRRRRQREDSLSSQLREVGADAVLLLDGPSLRRAIVDLLLSGVLAGAHQLVLLGQVSDLSLQTVDLALHGSATDTFMIKR